MKLPSGQSICKIQVIEEDDPNPGKMSNYDKTSLLVLSLTVFLVAGSIIFIVYQAQHHCTENHVSSNEFRKMVEEIFLENNELLKTDGVIIEVEVLDKNSNLLWLKPIDKASLRDEGRIENEIVDEFEEMKDEISQQPLIRIARSVQSSNTKEYVVSHQTQFVNCDHFKPIPRGKYLVPPSLHALHTCYQFGVTMSELDRGILKREEGGEFRYNLQDLYVACHDVFNDRMDELTSELRNDYERCKWSGALDENEQKVVEERFAPHFVPSNEPENLQLSSSPYPSTTLPSPTTTTPSIIRVDPRAFVECSHVETEMFEDSFESPSPEALPRCQKFGVTYDELRRGFSQNPRPEQTRLNVGNLYMPCQYVFDGNLEYLTNELKEDYRRCKRVRALTKETLAKVERKFYEQLFDERVTSRRPERPATTSSSTTATTTTTTTTTSDDFEQRQTTTTTTTAVNIPPAFANCKRVENKEYYICIKVITSSNGPVINV